MKKSPVQKLKDAEKKLKINFPSSLFKFLSTLDNPEVSFGEEEWIVWTLNDSPGGVADNFIVASSLDFKNEWGLSGLVFATNGIGDYLVVIPEKFGEQILVIMHETAEIKLFGNSIDEVMKFGPEDYFWSDDYLFKIDDDGSLVEGKGEDQSESGPEGIDFLDEDDKLRSYLDDLIDDQQTEKTSELIVGLEKPFFRLAKAALTMTLLVEAIAQVAVDGIPQDRGKQAPLRRFDRPALIHVKIFVNAENIRLAKQPGFFLGKAVVAVVTIVRRRVAIQHVSSPVAACSCGKHQVRVAR